MITIKNKTSDAIPEFGLGKRNIMILPITLTPFIKINPNKAPKNL